MHIAKGGYMLSFPGPFENGAWSAAARTLYKCFVRMESLYTAKADLASQGLYLNFH